MKNWLLVVLLFSSSLQITAQTPVLPPGSGTAGDPYLISTVDHLAWISANNTSWNKYFRQENNIDATGTVSWNGGLGFTPIAPAFSFSGQYDGQFYVIDGLAMSRASSDYSAFIGYTSSAAVVKNLGLTNLSVTGKQYTGGVVGYNSGQILNCFSMGTVHGYYATGGIVGFNSAPGSVTACFSTATVTCSTDRAGGICGYNNGAGAQITNSYATGNVTATGIRAGGLLGYNNGGSVVNCYSTGIPTASSSTGGLTGGPNATGTTGSFWDTETSTRTSSPGGGTGLTSLQMKSDALFLSAGWDFETETDNGTTDYWALDGVTNGGYPYLKWQENNSASLPVELISFTGIVKDGTVLLNWSTATEDNNYGWEIEKQKLEGSSEKIEWETIGFVAGKGTTTLAQTYSFSSTFSSGKFRLKQIDTDGTVSFSQVLTFSENPTSAVLLQNYPNPFNPSTALSFSLPQAGSVSLVIFDILGREVATVLNENRPAGLHSVLFDASGISSGTYLCRFSFNGQIQTRKLNLLK
ncbi:MAG: T9SS type A sorting domain-containing protein [Bacteroidetes bacterium]|nr:T9SS type A sorting domain-containing protein [Bacteroidota bacterium]